MSSLMNLLIGAFTFELALQCAAAEKNSAAGIQQLVTLHITFHSKTSFVQIKFFSKVIYLLLF